MHGNAAVRLRGLFAVQPLETSSGTWAAQFGARHRDEVLPLALQR